MENEVWKPILNYEGYYEVSNLGRIKSVTREIIHVTGVIQMVHERVLKPQKHTHGYKSIGLHKDGKQEGVLIHRMVAECFVWNPNNHKIINHIDGDKSNNNYKNLEWCTYSENGLHAFKIGLRNNPKRGKSVFAKKIINTKTKKVFDCVLDAFDEYNQHKYNYFVAMIKGSRRNKTDYEYYIENKNE